MSWYTRMRTGAPDVRAVAGVPLRANGRSDAMRVSITVMSNREWIGAILCLQPYSRSACPLQQLGLPVVNDDERVVLAHGSQEQEMLAIGSHIESRVDGRQ